MSTVHVNSMMLRGRDERPRRRLPVLLAVVVMTCLCAWALCAAPASAAPPDIGSSPYALQIEVFTQLGIVEGFLDGTFRPHEPVTRQQFAKMIVLAMRIPVSEEDVCPFVDVRSSGPDSLFPDNYVAAAAREGITTGTKAATSTSGALFGPGLHISLAQMITMASRGAGRPLAPPPSSYRPTWGDFDSVHWPAARMAQYHGLLREFPLESMYPWRSATRAEAVALLFNLMGTDPAALNGRFLGTSADLVRYFRTASSRMSVPEKFSCSVEELARLYVEYGRRFGIRADMAWVQMCHETGFGRYGGDVLPEQNNYAGIGATGGGVQGNEFATPELGVIAQIAHLAWYTYPDHVSDPYCVRSYDPTSPGDPRHFNNHLGCGRPHPGGCRIVQDLTGRWAASTVYGDSLYKMAQKITPTAGW